MSNGVTNRVARYDRSSVHKYLREGAALANLEVYYAIRLPSSDVPERESRHPLKRPVGRPPRKPIIWYHDFQYQAGSWEQPPRAGDGVLKWLDGRGAGYITLGTHGRHGWHGLIER